MCKLNGIAKNTKLDDDTTKRKNKSDRVIEINMESIEEITKIVKEEMKEK